MTDDETPSAQDAARCMKLREQSKSGVRLHPDDQQFVEHMWQAYPLWYKRQEKTVFENTKPFGAKV